MKGSVTIELDDYNALIEERNRYQKLLADAQVENIMILQKHQELSDRVEAYWIALINSNYDHWFEWDPKAGTYQIQPYYLRSEKSRLIQQGCPESAFVKYSMKLNEKHQQQELNKQEEAEDADVSS